MEKTTEKKNNKIILRVKKDLFNKWFYFGKKGTRVQLAGDPRKGGYWLMQYADKALGKEGSAKFMSDFTEILKLMEVDNAEIFSVYESKEEQV